MTKKKLLLTLLGLILFAGILFWMKKETTPLIVELPAEKPAQMKTNPPPQVDVQNLKIDGKKVMGLHPGKEKEEIKKLKMANNDTNEWEEKLEDALRDQGGPNVGEIQIKKVESLILAQDGLALNVTSAIVTLENEKKEKTTFRVLVDSETGKVLQNWDQPVIDPINPREGFGIKLDSRYHND